MNKICPVLVTALLAATASAAEEAPARASRDAHGRSQRPNIIFLLSDDQRDNSFGAMGHPFIKTPNVDRLLEHSRIMQFHHGGENLVFISSADWMARNLDRRIELVVPIENRACKKRLIQVLDTCLKDTEKSRMAQPDGSYVRLKALKSGRKVRSQEVLYKKAVETGKVIRQARRTEFEPHRPPKNQGR